MEQDHTFEATITKRTKRYSMSGLLPQSAIIEVRPPATHYGEGFYRAVLGWSYGRGGFEPSLEEVLSTEACTYFLGTAAVSDGSPDPFEPMRSRIEDVLNDPTSVIDGR